VIALQNGATGHKLPQRGLEVRVEIEDLSYIFEIIEAWHIKFDTQLLHGLHH